MLRVTVILYFMRLFCIKLCERMVLRRCMISRRGLVRNSD